MKHRPSLNVPACGPLRLQLDVPGTRANQPTRRHAINLNAAQAELVRLAAGRFGVKLDTFILAALHGELTVETLPIPPRALARTQGEVRMALAMITPEERTQLDAIASAKGYTSALDFLVDEQWRDFIQVRVSTRGQRRCLFPRTLWNRVNAMMGVGRPPQIIAPVFGQPVHQPLAAAA